MNNSITEVCVLTDPYLRDYEVRALEKAIANTGVKISLVIVCEPDDTSVNPDTKAKAINKNIGINTIRMFINVAKQEKWWSLVLAEKKISEQLGYEPAASTQMPINQVEVFKNAKKHITTPIKDGAWTELPPETVQTVQNNCDVAIRFGCGLLKGDILNAPKHGILSFHPADIRKYRGLGPPIAWLDGRDTIGLTLQRLNDEIDAGEIISYSETDISECSTLWEIYNNLHDIKGELLTESIQVLQRSSSPGKVPESLGTYHSIKTRQTFTFSMRILLKNILGKLQYKR